MRKCDKNAKNKRKSAIYKPQNVKIYIKVSYTIVYVIFFYYLCGRISRKGTIIKKN